MKLALRQVLLPTLLGVAFCGWISPGTHGQAKTKEPPVIRRTTYYLHGRIYTNDPKHPWAAALAVRDEKILHWNPLRTSCWTAERQNFPATPSN